MTTKNLITGISGFVGSHLAELLLNKDEKVSGIKRWRSPMDNINHIKNKVELYDADITDPVAINKVIKKIQPNKIFHLAAQSLVPYSFDNPHETIRTNINGTINLLEAVRNAKIDPIIHICSCYSEDTKILSSNGLVSYKEIREGDLIFSLNPKTKIIEQKKVKKVLIYNFNSTLKHIKTRSIDLLVTPNHKLLLASQKGGHYKFMKVESDGKSARGYMPRGIWKGIDKKIITLPQQDTFDLMQNSKTTEFRTEDIFYLTGLYIGDGNGDILLKTTKTKTGMHRKEYLQKGRDKTGKFIKLKEQYGVSTQRCDRIFLNIPKNDKARKKTETILKSMGLKYHSYDQSVYLSSRPLLKFLKQCGKDAHNKNIPKWMLNFDTPYLKSLYEGLIDSDGYYAKETHHVYRTVSEKLVESMIELCIKLGKFVTYSSQNNNISFINKRKIICPKSYTLSISDRDKTFEKRNIYDVYYNGVVWCLEVEDNHNFLIHRNGKTHFCGNSSEVYGQVTKEDIPIKETCPLRPQSPYAVSKVGEDLIAYQYFCSYGLKTIRTRMFTHSGPRRGELFFESAFIKQIVQIEKGLQKPIIHVGNLKSIRTLAHVKDAVRAYWLMAKKCPPGEVYNIGGNTTMTVGDYLKKMIELSDLNSQEVKIKVDKNLLRPSDVTLQIPDTTKFRKATGWKPEIKYEQIFIDLLEYWRERI